MRIAKQAAIDGRSIYANRVVPPVSGKVLKPGSDNVKLGAVVTKGVHTGATMYQLSLEERKTCPRSCEMWTTCYGNNMQFAHRIDHTHPEFYKALGDDIDAITRKHRRVLVRLHVLGDFFSEQYVQFWHGWLLERHNLACFGYTAHMFDTALGGLIDAVADDVGWERFAIRHSGLDSDTRSALVRTEEPDMDAFWCPEQMGQATSCADCGACWNGTRTVLFKPH